MHISFKRYGHEQGLSCCFRQPTATSHCNLLHGYALAIEMEFHAETLDHRNWVMDFGGFKDVKAWIQKHFDHTLLVARDDPHLEILTELDIMFSVARVIVLDRVGCEAFAEMIYEYVANWTYGQTNGRVTLHKVTVSEHGANGAAYVG